MKFTFTTAAATILAASLIGSFAYASDAKPPVKKHVAARKAKTSSQSSVTAQIQAKEA